MRRISSQAANASHEEVSPVRGTAPAVKKAFRVLKVTFGVTANTERLLPDLFFSTRFESLLTDFHTIEPIEYRDKGLDFYVTMTDIPGKPVEIQVSDEGIHLTGSIVQTTEQVSDLRYTIFGNEGLLFRYILMMLEKKHGIYSLHACSLYDEQSNHLYIAAGTSGSGKSCLLVKGLEMGLKLFSAEMTHFHLDPGPVFYKGAVVDNVRIGNLKYNYPFLMERLKGQLPQTDDEWGRKVAVDLGEMQTASDTLRSPKITVILPRVEQGRRQNFTRLEDRRVTRKALFDNISEKIASSVLLYDSIPVGGLDGPVLMKGRCRAIDGLLDYVECAVKVVAGSENCWEGLMA
jgi:hypothetical protein